MRSRVGKAETKCSDHVAPRATNEIKTLALAPNRIPPSSHFVSIFVSALGANDKLEGSVQKLGGEWTQVVRDQRRRHWLRGTNVLLITVPGRGSTKISAAPPIVCLDLHLHQETS